MEIMWNYQMSLSLRCTYKLLNGLALKVPIDHNTQYIAIC